MQAVVLTFDRLQQSFLGCYGNEWIDTPNFDRLASQSIVFDQHFGEDFHAAAANHAWWTGCYQFPRTTEQQTAMATLVPPLRDLGVSTRLLVEKAEGDLVGPVPAFDAVEEITGLDGQQIDAAQTPLAGLVRRAIECLKPWSAGDDQHRLLWLKSRGVPHARAAPQAFARLYADKLDEVGDPSVLVVTDTQAPVNQPVFSTPSWRVHRAAYAGYIAFIDFWLGKLLDRIDEIGGAESPLFIISAAMGELDGAREGVDSLICPLPEQRVHTPLMIQSEKTRHLGERSQVLVQPTDLVPTLLQAFCPRAALMSRMSYEGRSLMPLLHDGGFAPRDYVCLGDGAGNRAIRTRDFYLVETTASAKNGLAVAPIRKMLFTKPADVWDTYDVADQTPDEVQELSRHLGEFIKRAEESLPMRWPELEHSS